jgi:hypothetical protein
MPGIFGNRWQMLSRISDRPRSRRGLKLQERGFNNFALILRALQGVYALKRFGSGIEAILRILSGSGLTFAGC